MEFPNNLISVLIGIVLILPAIFDGCTQILEFRISNNNLRFITGYFGGLGVLILVKALVTFIKNFYIPYI